jgi:tetratricopeptide (TPR) repeat protein
VATLHRARGVARAALGDWKNAAADFSHAGSKSNSDAECERGLALAAVMASNRQEALRHASQGIVSASQDGSLYYLRASILGPGDHSEDRLRDLTLAIEGGADHLQSRVNRAMLLLAARRYRECVGDLDLALKTATRERPDLHYFRGQARAGLGQWEQALGDFRNAADLVPHSARNVRAAVLLAERVDSDERQRHRRLRELLQQQPRTIENEDRLLADVIWPATVFPNADVGLANWLPYMQKVLAKHLSPEERNRVLGAALYRTGQSREAIRQLMEATKADPDGGTAWDWFFLALAHHALKDSSTAQAALSSARAWMQRKKDGLLRNPLHLVELSWMEELELRILEAEVARLVKEQH